MPINKALIIGLACLSIGVVISCLLVGLVLIQNHSQNVINMNGEWTIETEYGGKIAKEKDNRIFEDDGGNIIYSYRAGNTKDRNAFNVTERTSTSLIARWTAVQDFSHSTEPRSVKRQTWVAKLIATNPTTATLRVRAIRELVDGTKTDEELPVGNKLTKKA